MSQAVSDLKRQQKDKATMSHILIIRHAQASFGAADYDSLSDLGQIQAQKLGLWFAQLDLKPDRIITGGMKRHAQTAALSLKEMGMDLPLTADNAFAEYDHLAVIDAHDPNLRQKLMEDRALGKSIDMVDFKNRFTQAVARWTSGKHDDDYAETYAAFVARVEAGLKRLADTQEADETVLVYTSGGPKAMLYKALSGVDTHIAFDMGHRFLNTSIMRLNVRDKTPSLLSLNGVPHLEVMRDPSLFTFI